MNPDLVPDGWRFKPLLPYVSSKSPKNRLRRAARIREIAKRDGWHCRFCLRQLAFDGGVRVRATIDHWVPRARRGTDKIENLVIADQPCNQIKGSMTGDEFLAIPYEEREELRVAWLAGLEKM